MSLAKALNTLGWMTPEELTWLNDRAKEYPKVVELGSYMGRSTLALAEHAEFVIAIDDWVSPHPWFTSSQDRAECRRKFQENLADYIKSGRVLDIVSDHRDVHVQVLPKEPPFDMVFIDGGHEYKEVLGDIKFWSPLLRKGGLCCGHDYCAGWPDVIRAVNECFSSPWAVAGSIWSVLI